MTEAEIITKFRGIDPKRASTITSGIFLLEIILSHYSNSPIIISGETQPVLLCMALIP